MGDRKRVATSQWLDQAELLRWLSSVPSASWLREEEAALLIPRLETAAEAGRAWEGTRLSSFSSRASHEMFLEQVGEGKKHSWVSRGAIKATKLEDVFRTSSLTNSIFLSPSMSYLILRVEAEVMNEVRPCERDVKATRTTKHWAISGDSHAERECFRGRKPETASREALWAFLLQSHYDFNSLFWLLQWWRFFVWYLESTQKHIKANKNHALS